MSPPSSPSPFSFLSFCLPLSALLTLSLPRSPSLSFALLCSIAVQAERVYGVAWVSAGIVTLSIREQLEADCPPNSGPKSAAWWLRFPATGPALAREPPEPPGSTPAGQSPPLPVLATSSSAVVTLDGDPAGSRDGATMVHVRRATTAEQRQCGNRTRSRIGVPFATREILVPSISAAGQPDRPSISCTDTVIAVVFQAMFYLWHRTEDHAADTTDSVVGPADPADPNDPSAAATASQPSRPLQPDSRLGGQWEAMLLPEPCVSGGVRANMLFTLSHTGRLHLWHPEGMRLIGSVELGESPHPSVTPATGP